MSDETGVPIMSNPILALVIMHSHDSSVKLTEEDGTVICRFCIYC